MPDKSSGDPIPNPKDLLTSDQHAANETPYAPRLQIPAPLPVKIGQYHVRRLIASGGMGTVYEATQERPRRPVAVKVMRHGVTSRAAMRRFEHESQLLARLQHPGIAQVYEAGTYDDPGAPGAPVPFFAMEYIPNARRITDFIRERALGVSERLALFAEVCDALEHGHLKGIIHRDLKPANVLIDSHGHAKIIDFGVARATDSDMAVTTLRTDVGQLIGTLQYMSPEQCEADPHDLDPRSDVYALGVLAYEILCDRLPYDLTGMVIAVATRVIRECQPPRPSAIVSTLRGDVETIILKALEKDRERRYRSAGELGDDVRRYLNSEPIFARPASLVYQVRVFARRNRIAFGAAAAVLFAVSAGLAVSTFMYLRAEAERDAAVVARGESDAVIRFLDRSLSSVDPLVHGPNVTVLEILDESARNIGDAFRGQPLVEATLRRTLGNSYTALENCVAAETHLGIALELRQRRLPQESEEVAESQYDLARAMQGLGRRDEAEELYRRALATRRRLLGNDHAAVAATLNDLATCLYNVGRIHAAEPLLREALVIRRRRFGGEHLAVAQTLDNLGAVLQSKSQFDEARALHSESLAIRRKLMGPDHLSVAYSLNSLSACFKQVGEMEAAEQYLREALAITTQLRNNRHALGAAVLLYLGEVLHAQGKLVEAEAFFSEALQAHLESVGEEDMDTARTLTGLAKCLLDRQKYAEVETYGLRALDVQRRFGPEAAFDLAETLHTMGNARYSREDCPGAEPLLREALDIQRNLPRPNPALLARTLDTLGTVFSECGKPEDGEAFLREAVEKFAATAGPHDWKTGSARSHWGSCLTRLGRYDEAERELLEGHRVLEAARGPTDLRTLKAIERLIALYDAKGDGESAAKYRNMLTPPAPSSPQSVKP